MDKQTVQMLVSVGGKWKKDEIYELESSDIEALSLKEGEHYKTVTEKDAAETKRNAQAEKTQTAIAQKTADLVLESFHQTTEKAAAGTKFSFGPEQIDKDPNHGYDWMHSWLTDVKGASSGVPCDKLIQSSRAQAELVRKTAGHMTFADDEQGGFLVPEGFLNELIREVVDMNVVINRCRVIPMQTTSISIPSINESSRANSIYGGIVIYWPDAEETKTETKPKFSKVRLTLHKAAGLVYAVDELLQDSPMSVEALIRQLFGEAIAFELDEQLLLGTGVGMPLGNIPGPATIAVNRTGALAVVALDIQNMWERLAPECKANSVWMINQEVMSQLMNMTLAIGAGGSTLFIPAGGYSAVPYSTLMGRPIIETEHCPGLGTLGDVTLTDWRRYFIGQPATGAGAKFDQSIHVRFIQDETTFRFVQRIDGQQSWAQPRTPKHGTNTVSMTVVLDVPQ